MAETHIGRSHGHAFEKCSADLQVMLYYVIICKCSFTYNNLYALGVIMHACVELHNTAKRILERLGIQTS